MNSSIMGAALRTLAVGCVASLVWTGVAHGADPVASPPVPAPSPASPSLLPPYAVWESTPIPEAGEVAGFDMAIGKDGRMHFAIADANTGALVYMVGMPGHWLTSTVEYSPTMRFSQPSIALGASGTPQVAYLARDRCSDDDSSDAYLRQVRHAELENDTWLSSEVTEPFTYTACDPAAHYARATDITLDGDGLPWIAWSLELHEVWSPGALLLAQRSTAGEWQQTQLMSSWLGNDIYFQLAADSSGGVHAAYSTYLQDTHGPPRSAFLEYTKWRAGVEQSTEFRPGIAAPVPTSVSVDDLGRVFIAYSGCEIALIRGENSAWITGTVPIGTLGVQCAAYPSIAISGDGLPALAAKGWTTYDKPAEVYFFWWDGFGWRGEGTGLEHAEGYVLAFDGNTPVVAYRDSDTGALSIARRVPVVIGPRAWLPAVARQ